jgi:bile acid-coenzyme A ligase
MTATPATPISYGRRLAQRVAEDPGRPAVIFAPREGAEQLFTRRDLDAASNRVARLLATRGIGQGTVVALALPNCPAHFVVAYAVWKLGGLALALRADQPARERDDILALARPALIVADWDTTLAPVLRAADLAAADRLPADPLPDRISNPGRALASGGSSGRPKIIVTPGPLAAAPGAIAARLAPWGFRPGQVQLVAGPLYHAMPFVCANSGLFEGHTLVVMDRFDAARAVDLIARHRVQFAYFAPTMLRRIAQLPALDPAPFASIQAIISAGAPCPPDLKRAWLDLVGPERLYEFYGMSENVGSATIRGDEWLARPGSVGRPQAHDVLILDADDRPLPPGEVGEIFMRPKVPAGPTYEYLGAPPARTTHDGFTSVGDLGWLDDDGYLYIADRRTDMIITGGANVFAAEVEAALGEHPAIADLAVIGVPDDAWGKRVHAIIQPCDPLAPPAIPDLDAHCRARLMAYKLPKSYEFVAELPRTEAGKLRRSALAAERVAGWTPAMLPATRR